MVTFSGFHLHHRLALQDLFFYSTDFGIADHTTFQQQVARRRAGPAVYRHWRITLTGPGNHTAHPLQLFMDVLHRFNRRIKQLAESIGNQFRSGVLNKIGFARLRDERE